MFFEKYYKNSNRYICFSTRFGKWKASDFVAEIKDKIYLFPCLCFYFNSSEFYISFAWLNYICWFAYINYEKHRIY